MKIFTVTIDVTMPVRITATIRLPDDATDEDILCGDFPDPSFAVNQSNVPEMSMWTDEEREGFYAAIVDEFNVRRYEEDR